MNADREAWEALSAPFGEREVKSRNKAGRVVNYVDARAVMRRLDEVLGPGGWWDRYSTVDEGCVQCELTVVFEDGPVTKSDFGAARDPMDPKPKPGQAARPLSDAEKRASKYKDACSDALKRTAVKFGVARYLYGEGVGSGGGGGGARPATERRGNGNGNGNGDHWTGRRLYQWARQQDEEDEGLLLTPWLSANCKSKWGVSKLVDLDDDQSRQAHNAAVKRIAELHKSAEFQRELEEVPY